jgi:hypothetical protein
MSLRQKKVSGTHTGSFSVQVRYNLVEELGFVQGLFLHTLRVQPKEKKSRRRSEDPRGWDTLSMLGSIRGQSRRFIPDKTGRV